ncbi:alpha/beta fold hydrolase [Halomonas tibetensis]|uniref:Alpha/beta fold hydrolase n=1 Tax=Halomonas tibetensis TaxID=2259590 RepID=A0ABV7B8Y0_9GAMM
MSQADIIRRNNVKVTGQGGPTLLLAHGFGCDQNMWRFITPQLERDYRVVLFDYVGSGRSQLSAFDRDRYASLDGYAQDIVEICESLDLGDVTLVGHSVSGIIGLLASLQAPEYFAGHVMVCPSPCFLNVPPDYEGGFEHQDLQDLIDLMDKNYIGWANYLAPLVMGSANGAALAGELSGSFCSTDPVVAKAFAMATFFSDYRHVLADAQHPSLILQSSRDNLAPPTVGRYMQAHMPDSTLAMLEIEGHCPHMSHPDLVVEALQGFLAKRRHS